MIFRDIVCKLANLLIPKKVCLWLWRIEFGNYIKMTTKLLLHLTPKIMEEGV
jgi:hypothetical protein